MLIYIEERFKTEGHRRNLTLIYAAGQGDGKMSGLNHMGHEGLVGRVIGGHIGLAPRLQNPIREKKVLAYNFPQGVISTLLCQQLLKDAPVGLIPPQEGFEEFIKFSKGWQKGYIKLFDVWLGCLEKTSEAYKSAEEKGIDPEKV